MISKQFSNPISNPKKKNCISALDLAMKKIYGTNSLYYGDDSEKINKILRHLEIYNILTKGEIEYRDQLEMGDNNLTKYVEYISHFNLLNFEYEMEQITIDAINKFEEFYTPIELEILEMKISKRGCFPTFILVVFVCLYLFFA